MFCVNRTRCRSSETHRGRVFWTTCCRAVPAGDVVSDDSSPSISNTSHRRRTHRHDPPRPSWNGRRTRWSAAARRCFGGWSTADVALMRPRRRSVWRLSTWPFYWVTSSQPRCLSLLELIQTIWWRPSPRHSSTTPSWTSTDSRWTVSTVTTQLTTVDVLDIVKYRHLAA